MRVSWQLSMMPSGLWGEAGLDQWQDGYPSEEIIRDDIRNGESRVWEEDGTILGTAMLSFRGRT